MLTSWPSHILFAEEKVHMELWFILAKAHETFFNQKSRLRWLKEGDANTGFFHITVKLRQTINAINHLRSESNVRVSNKEEVKDTVISYTVVFWDLGIEMLFLPR